MENAYTEVEENQTKQLKAILSEVSNKSKSVPTDFFLLYDASGSVSDDDFNFAKIAGGMLVANFGNNSLAGFGQFSNDFHLQAALTHNLKEAADTHRTMKKKSGGTNTTDALLQSLKVFQFYGRKDSQKYLYIFTDGIPNDLRTAIEAGRKVREQGVNIIAVGIGNVNTDALRQVCGDAVYHIQDYKTLLDVVQFPPDTTACSPEIEISFKMLNAPIGLQDNLEIEVTVKNVDEGGELLPQKISVVASAGDFYERAVPIIDLGRSLKSNEKTSFTIQMEPSGNADINNLPEYINFQLKPLKSQVPFKCKYDAMRIEIPNLMRDFLNWLPPRPEVEKANILIFGVTGSGKSSLINEFHRLFVKTAKVAIVLRSEDHVTQKSGASQIKHISFLDTVGLSDHTYKNHELAAIINGALPVGYNILDSDFRKVQTAMMDNQETSAQRKIHACIICVTQALRMDDASSGRVKEIVKEIVIQHEIRPILVVTHMDEADESVWGDIQKEFAGITGINIPNIHLIDNSPRDDEDVPFILQHKLFQILNQVLNNASVCIKSQPRTFTQVPPNNSVPNNQTGHSNTMAHSNNNGTTASIEAVHLCLKDSNISYTVMFFDEVTGDTTMDKIREAIYEQHDELQMKNLTFYAHSTTGATPPAIPQKMESKCKLSRCLSPANTVVISL